MEEPARQKDVYQTVHHCTNAQMSITMEKPNGMTGQKKWGAYGVGMDKGDILLFDFIFLRGDPIGLSSVT